ncbi:hypothetical protein ACIRPT_17245 [Streptomyces sp. NPDC101227]|uniref:hypothetical protein n=1 Tax=Streptomyces sp. NPDC101227 TaxID=3366136 RepID=UPI003828D72F
MTTARCRRKSGAPGGGVRAVRGIAVGTEARHRRSRRPPPAGGYTGAAVRTLTR